MTTSTAPTPGPHGGDGARLARILGVAPDAVLDLSASCNPGAPDVAALVAEHADAVRTYPDAGPATRALAAALEVDPDRLVLTNGGAEAIALVAAEHPAGWVDQPEFSLYARHLASLDPVAPRWRSNPHNPTGRLAGPDETADVWDEAFYALATGRWTRGDPASIVVGSLTKLFACPGLRLGYALTPDPDLAARLRARQPVWAVGGVGCAVLPALLETADLARWARDLAVGRTELTVQLRRAGLTPERSDASFVLVPHAPGLREHLARHTILVRDTASFGMPDGVRIGVPDPAGLARLDRALTGWTP
jgi:histidinol-phosphate/aromatic aminotransferase/cobyric acid decarboxylase-like protein